jgi:hypothetical protein
MAVVLSKVAVFDTVAPLLGEIVGASFKQLVVRLIGLGGREGSP